jgi:DNA-binding XRE family transcriptional regulator
MFEGHYPQPEVKSCSSRQLNVVEHLATLLCAMDSTSHHPLYQHRKAHYLTRQQMAAQIGCSTRTLARWEKGLYCPRLTFALKASQVTGLSILALSGEERS